MITKSTTQCCALAQFSGLNNDTTYLEIKEALLKAEIEAHQPNKVGSTEGKGQRAYFVITTPSEGKLEETLEEAGFKEIHQFERRVGYPEGILKMFIINL